MLGPFLLISFLSEFDMKQSKIGTVVVLAVGGLLGWLAASGHFTKTFAQDKKADPGQVAGTSTATYRSSSPARSRR
jgi:hypothetical protein